MNNPSVYIIILNWNGLKDTIECIESLKKNDYPNFQIVVVDNGSDTDVEQLSRINEIRLIRLSDNIGFSGGNNVGIKYAIENKADYVMLLNNDTIVNNDFLSVLINASQNYSASLFTPIIKYYSSPEKVWYGGGSISKFRGSAFDTRDRKLQDFTKEEFVEFASGCCILINRKVFEEIGLWDENYFLYLEDADFCKRSIDAGHLILLVPASQILHKVGSSTSEKHSEVPLYYMTRNRLYFTRKFFPRYLLIVSLYLFFTMLIKSFFWILKGQKSKSNTVKTAIIDFINKKNGKREGLK